MENELPRKIRSAKVPKCTLYSSQTGRKKLEFLETNRRIQDFHKLKRRGCGNFYSAVREYIGTKVHMKDNNGSGFVFPWLISRSTLYHWSLSSLFHSFFSF